MGYLAAICTSARMAFQNSLILWLYVIRIQNDLKVCCLSENVWNDSSLNVLAWKKLHYGFYTANNGTEQRFSIVFEQYGQLSYQRIAQDFGISITLKTGHPPLFTISFILRISSRS